MLNIYEGALKLVNPKLYNSPYKANVMQVLEILKKFKFRYRTIYLRNLCNLKIEVASEYGTNKESFSGLAWYNTRENKVYFNTLFDDEGKKVLNHELFHASSNNRKKHSGIVYSDNNFIIGKYLNEGITDYLNLKTQNVENQSWGYSEELFVIQVLVFIFGEDIIKPYLRNGGKKFFEQFGKNYDKILNLDTLLSVMDYNAEMNYYRLAYLYFASLPFTDLPCDIDFLNELQLNQSSFELIQTLLLDCQLKLEKLDLKIDDKADFKKQIYNDDFFQTFKEAYIFGYYENQRPLFKDIYNILKQLAYGQGIAKEDFEKFVISIFNKQELEFKKIYSNCINEENSSYTRR